MAATSKHSCVARAHSDMLSFYMAGLTSLPEAAMLFISFWVSGLPAGSFKRSQVFFLLYLFPVAIVLCIPNHAVQTQERGEGLEERKRNAPL